MEFKSGCAFFTFLLVFVNNLLINEANPVQMSLVSQHSSIFRMRKGSIEGCHVHSQWRISVILQAAHGNVLLL
jgi:hypothetical protein